MTKQWLNETWTGIIFVFRLQECRQRRALSSRGRPGYVAGRHYERSLYVPPTPSCNSGVRRYLLSLMIC